MDSINPWLDVNELNRLANALVEPAKKSNSDVRVSASKILAKASEQAKRAGIVSEKPLVVPPRQADLPELSAWLTDHARCEGLCVVDRDGDVLHAVMPNEEWVKLTVSAATTGHRLEKGKSPSIRMKVSAVSYLQFISVVTARGSLLIGLLTRNLLDSSQVSDFSALVEKISAGDQVEKS